jgi:hypothetical protein
MFQKNQNILKKLKYKTQYFFLTTRNKFMRVRLQNPFLPNRHHQFLLV